MRVIEGRDLGVPPAHGAGVGLPTGSSLRSSVPPLRCGTSLAKLAHPAVRLTRTTALCGLLLAACATAPLPPPQAFGASEAFTSAQRRIGAFTPVDLDGDGIVEEIAAERSPAGYAAVLYGVVGGEGQRRWTKLCQSDMVEGEELGRLVILKSGAVVYVLVVVGSEDPEGRIENGALVVPAEDCRIAWAGRASLLRAPGDVVAPASLPGGIRAEGGGIGIVEAPKYLGLEGEAGPISLLYEVRVRRVQLDRGGVAEDSQRLSLLVHPTQKVERDGAAQPQLGDGKDDVALDAEPAAGLSLTLTAEKPIVGLDIRYGCDAPAVTSPPPSPAAAPNAAATAATEPPVGVGRAAADPYHWALRLDSKSGHYVEGTLPAAEGPIRAVGRSVVTGPVRRALMLLDAPVTSLTMRVGPEDTRRCLREVRGFGLVD